MTFTSDQIAHIREAILSGNEESAIEVVFSFWPTATRDEAVDAAEQVERDWRAEMIQFGDHGRRWPFMALKVADTTLDPSLAKTRDALVAFTRPCREDMHEPDEQGIKVAIVGDHLDNACGAHISEKAIREGYQEYVVVLRRFDEESKKFLECAVNLATLVALARKAQ